MPLCLMCPQGNQPSFPVPQDLTTHISLVHAISESSSKQTPAKPPAALSNQCPTCQRKFTTAAGLAAHQQAKNHFFVCPSCNQTFKTRQLLEEHESSAHSPPPPPPPVARASPSPRASPNVGRTSTGPRCNQCGKTFQSYPDLEGHIGTSHKFPCSKCSERFPSLIDWNQHFNAVHKFQCGACKASFTSDAELVAHGSPCPSVTATRPTSSQSVRCGPPSPEQKNKAVCDVCKKSFKGKDGLQAHITSKHPSCGICQFRGLSPTALEDHVNKVHCCTICEDGILRDVKTLDDHMADHTHPYRCRRCGTKYQSEVELSTHFASLDNDHPVCTKCHIGLEDEAALRSHVSLVHPPSRRPSPRTELVCPHCPERFDAQVALEAHLAEVHSPKFECCICGESYSVQSALFDHVAADHSCPICQEGVYINTESLEAHLEDHRTPYRCVPCGLRYPEEDLLLQHYKESQDGIHPLCMRCDIGFENRDVYDIHVGEVHRPTPCETCDGLVFDEADLPAHYLSSRKHPKCDKCQVGFKDRFDFADHGALSHPESHCYHCRWQFDSPDSLHNHIRHFVNHPKCVGCDLRFPDATTYQHHLFVVHCSNPDATVAEPASIFPGIDGHSSSVTKVSPCSSPVGFPNVDCGSGSEADFTSLLDATSIPLPPSVSGYSSPTSQKVISDSSFQRGSESPSCSPTLSAGHSSPCDQSRQYSAPSLNVDTVHYPNNYVEFDHSPLSTVPAVGTPRVSGVQVMPSFDFRSPFSPRPEGRPVFHSTRGMNGLIDRNVHFLGEGEEGDSSSFTHSPQLISPSVKLPSPVAGSPTSPGWTSDSASVTKLSLNSRVSSPPVVRFASNNDHIRSPDHGAPDLTLQVPRTGNLVTGAAVSASPISPESAGISVSAVTQTPEFLREARAYLPLTQQTSHPSSPHGSQSPTNSSPVLSSTGLAIGDRDRRREVRFDDNIMSEPVWDRESTSTDTSLDNAVPYRRPNGLHSKKFAASKLPRFMSLKRRRMTNGRCNRVSHFTSGRAFDHRASALSYHCRVCLKDPCDDLTTTTCGHLFCYECISNSIIDDPHCPVCNAPTLLYCLFRIDLTA